MPALTSPLTPDAAEVDGLRSAMRDLQVSIGDFYRCSTGFADADTLATPVRACVSFIQVLNDVLQKDFGQAAAYCAMFEAPQDSRVEVIEAFRYVRNVGQHLLHPVRPDPSQAVGGAGLGFRTFAAWDDIPAAVHARLRPATQNLRAHYDTHLRGNEVTGTFLEAARFFWEVCPEMVHRQPTGEWTGFPLRHQAGVRSRLHPEESSDEAEALAWMASRKPGGDLRVICGCLHESTGEMVFGLTFTARCAFVPFFETPEQVSADIALGFEYHEGDVAANTRVNDRIPDFGGAFPATLCSPQPLESWLSSPVQAPPTDTEWSVYEQTTFWRQQLMTEVPGNAQWFLTRRERRLNAWYPIH